RAETLAHVGRTVDASRALDEALATPGATARDRDDVEIVQVRLRLGLAGAASDEPPAELVARAEAAARAAAARGLRPPAFRLALGAARLAERSDAAGAADAAARLLPFARTLFEEIRMATPDHHRPGLDADPDARWLAGLGTAAPGGAAADLALAARAAET